MGQKDEATELRDEFRRISKKIASAIDVETDWTVLAFVFLVHGTVSATLGTFGLAESVESLEEKIQEILVDSGFDSRPAWFEDKIFGF